MLTSLPSRSDWDGESQPSQPDKRTRQDLQNRHSAIQAEKERVAVVTFSGRDVSIDAAQAQATDVLLLTH